MTIDPEDFLKSMDAHKAELRALCDYLRATSVRLSAEADYCDKLAMAASADGARWTWNIIDDHATRLRAFSSGIAAFVMSVDPQDERNKSFTGGEKQ